ncbi:hypothetical protein [Alteromonas gilva]|uniref:Uncharacterized protein n=1 Tax=Alteromonas gilva TaxID=2987522 RepID=A0ABT5KZW5_9ALTE|nr:hypothetical protein [Alteromonas gilva]MDC8829796.1 hypothetical protein [Alteromonas gilva]
MLTLRIIAVIAALNCTAVANASDRQSCSAPAYQKYIDAQYARIEARSRRALVTSRRDYERSVENGANVYRVIADLSRHLIYSAQFEPAQTVNKKIALIFELGNTLSRAQQIAGEVFDSFSRESHSVSIAQAWLAYRQGKHAMAFEKLLSSIDITDSAVLSSFGPDFNLVRQMYLDGHVAPVVAYIRKTQTFWKGQRADEQRNVWLNMIKAGCPLQFDSVDVIKAAELGISVTTSHIKH